MIHQVDVCADGAEQICDVLLFLKSVRGLASHWHASRLASPREDISICIGWDSYLAEPLVLGAHDTRKAAADTGTTGAGKNSSWCWEH